MPNAKRPLRIVPAPVVTDRAGNRHLARCPLCRETLAGRPVAWTHLDRDPKGLRRCVHALCAHEYRTFVRAARPLV
jgi:hypothetical protein